MKRSSSELFCALSTLVWWKVEEYNGKCRRKEEKYLYYTDSSGVILYFRAFQGHSGRNLVDPTQQDNVLIPRNSFQYIYHIGSAINLDSIVNSGLIPGGQNLGGKDRRYSLRLWIPWTRITKIRTSFTWPNHVLHGTSRKRGKDTKIRCMGSIYRLLNGKDWSSSKQDRTQSSFTIHPQLIVSRKLL